MEILVLVAGTNDPSNADALADAFTEGMQQSGDITIHKRRLRDYALEHFTLAQYQQATAQEPAFLELADLLRRASGFVIATPVWNFSVPAHLKNFIDRLGRIGLDDATRSRGTLGGKPFYLLFTGGSPVTAWTGLMRATTSHLPQSLQYFGASYIGHHFEGRCMLGRGKFGLVVDSRPESLRAARRKGLAFAKTVEQFQRTGLPPARHRLRALVFRIGERLLKAVAP